MAFSYTSNDGLTMFTFLVTLPVVTVSIPVGVWIFAFLEAHKERRGVIAESKDYVETVKAA